MFLFRLYFEMLVAFQATCANLDASSSCRLRKCRPLEIGILTGIACRIKLGCADTVGIPSDDARSFITDDADIC